MELPKPVAGPLLQGINSPSDLKTLDLDQLPDVCQEIRDYIIDSVSVYGGHFGASLGAVELTVAMHYVYNTPDDLVVWDVGHQAYGHKILTGRRDNFKTNRKYGGISGFPKRSESEYDTFGVGHSSTSISAALGMAIARDLQKSDKRVIALIGDGAMTAGLAFEGLNNAGAMKSDMIVILNDNNMSIDPNVGALNEYLTDITTSQTFNKLRDELYDLLGNFKGAGEKMRKAASRLEKAVTSALTPGSLFRALGFKYYGPVDGHNVKNLVKTLNDLQSISGPKLLHAVTIKGKGFAPAERDQAKWHAQGSPFDKITGKSLVVKKSHEIPKYQKIFGDTIIDLAKKNENIVGITAAMPSGTGLLDMMKEFPDRAFDVGIAEQHAVTYAAGLATQGIKPFVAIYSTFLQRAYDQVIHDVVIQKLPVVFCLDRAGVVGADGATHHGIFDIAYLRCLPGIVVSAPMNETELRNLMYTASVYENGSFAIRYPRGKAVGLAWNGDYQKMEIGKGECVREGEDIAILSYGTIGNYVVKATQELAEKENIHIGHYNMRFVKPLDTELIDEIMANYNHLITIEDGAKTGGFGSAVAEYVVGKKNPVPVTIMGIPDRIVEQGTQQELHAECGIDKDGIIRQVKKLTLETAS